ncbi:SGNH/GDSL hydrolase family protein [Streptomyces sp900116325]|uniref:SGNH/GDSL hydrolase family protein n=1 Tax=Streptomyces sp. 900116325 TaxID=3154295 RepID=UPI0033C9CA1C
MDILSTLTLPKDPAAPGQAATARYADLWRRRDLPDPVVADALYAGAAPTISVAQTSTPTSGYIRYSPVGVALTGSDVTGPFVFLGAGNITVGTGTPDSGYVLPTSRYPNTRGNLTSSQSVWSVEFGTDAQTFQLRFNYQIAGMYRLSVDGRKITDLMQAVGGTTAGSTHMMTVDLGSAAPRTIRLDFYTVPFGGIYLPPTGTMWRVPPRGGRLVVLGDSLSDGSAFNVGGGAGTWVNRFARLAGCNDFWDEARGGTGYITPGSFATFADRVAADVIGWSPDRLIVWGGYNDNQGSQPAIASAAASLFSTIKSGLPNCQVMVIGCFSPTGTPATSVTNTDNTIKAAAAAAGYLFVSPLTGSCYDTSGTLVATQGAWITAANASTYINSTDSVHPNDAGHVYLSRRIHAAYRELIPT